MDHTDNGPRGFQFSAAPLGYLKHPKALVTSESYHVVITTSIPLNATDRQLQGNRGKYGGRGSLTSGRRCGVEVSTWKMFDWLQYNYLHKPPPFGKLVFLQIAKKFTESEVSLLCLKGTSTGPYHDSNTCFQHIRYNPI